MIESQFLRPGDTVLIIATARARNLEAIQPAINALRDWGYKVELGKNALKTYHQFAGNDDERAEDLQWALDHPTARAILISGGGYGALRIIDRISLDGFRNNPKWLVGYSDTTVLHARLLREGIACIHGTMAFQFERDEASRFSIKEVLEGRMPRFSWRSEFEGKSGEAEAIITGGNLSLIYALSGSVDDLDTKNKILFIEDLDEQLYHVDRMMMHLKRSGKLAHLAGMVVGGMTEMKDNVIPFGKTAETIILDAVKEYNYPICFDFPAGHIERNLAFILGKRARLSVSDGNCKLEYL